MHRVYRRPSILNGVAATFCNRPSWQGGRSFAKKALGALVKDRSRSELRVMALSFYKAGMQSYSIQICRKSDAAIH